MSKIRMALLGKCSYVGVAWINPATGKGEVFKINIPNRKQEMLKRILAQGLDFPEPKNKPIMPEHKSSIILPPEELLRQEREKTGKPMIVEA